MSLTEPTSVVAASDMDTSERPPSANGLKRRQSEEEQPEQESKRPRVSPGKSSPILSNGEKADEKTGDEKRDTPTEVKAVESKQGNAREGRRRGVVTDEKQRSKRLFGALLGNLNQPSDRLSKRRQEIESRRKAELQRQDDERLEDKQRRTEQLLQRRKKEQIAVDEQNMRIRHSNILNAANFLQTTTEPRLYYRPWELRADEEDRVDEQIKEAQALVDKELAELKGDTTTDGKAAQQHDADEPMNDEQKPSEAALDGTGEQPPTKAVTEQATANVGVDDEHRAPAKLDEIGPPAKGAEVPDSPSADHSGEMEEEGDHVVEGDEDTVVY